MQRHYLQFDNPNGTKKFWSGSCDASDGPVTIQHGRVGAKPRTIVVPPERFSSVSAQNELAIRADKKRREGYYDVVTPQDGDSSVPTTATSSSSNAQSSKTNQSKVMAALVSAGDDDTWFF